eukprot:2486541-Rhodomonas_salina.1
MRSAAAAASPRRTVSVSTQRMGQQVKSNASNHVPLLRRRRQCIGNASCLRLLCLRRAHLSLQLLPRRCVVRPHLFPESPQSGPSRNHYGFRSARQETIFPDHFVHPTCRCLVQNVGTSVTLST